MDVITLKLSGEIDHHSAGAIRRRIDLELAGKAPRRVVLDFADVRFMDSSGIGLLLGRYRQLKERGSSLCVRNVRPQIDKVFCAAGLYQVIKKLG